MLERDSEESRKGMEAGINLRREIIDRVEISWCMDSMLESSNVSLNSRVGGVYECHVS